MGTFLIFNIFGFMGHPSVGFGTNKHVVNGQPFGSLPGYKTNLGVVAVPTIPVGGYVYCPDAKKWVIFAEPPTSPSAGRGTRRGGGTPLTRRRKGQERRG